jgi:hypothetical protein
MTKIVAPNFHLSMANADHEICYRPVGWGSAYLYIQLITRQNLRGWIHRLGCTSSGTKAATTKGAKEHEGKIWLLETCFLETCFLEHLS